MDPFQSIAGELRIRNGEFPLVINVVATLKICIVYLLSGQASDSKSA